MDLRLFGFGPCAGLADKIENDLAKLFSGKARILGLPPGNRLTGALLRCRRIREGLYGLGVRNGMHV
jgi:hypothetical protein